MNVQWTDETTFSRGETDRTPRVWVARFGPLRLIVVKGHIYHPDNWVWVCRGIHDGERELDAKTADEAKAEAVESLRKALRPAFEALKP
jgi:hypothetical protein